jgi:hypothetical protein
LDSRLPHVLCRAGVAVWNELSTLFPKAAERAVTIHIMVSNHGFLEHSPRERVVEVICSRLDQGVKPLPALRLHGCHAQDTVCPSLGVGFDYSGVEAMARGGMAISSDIPVHREICEDAVAYVEPYATASLVDTPKRALYDERAKTTRARLRARRAAMAGRQRT